MYSPTSNPGTKKWGSRGHQEVAGAKGGVVHRQEKYQDTLSQNRKPRMKTQRTGCGGRCGRAAGQGSSKRKRLTSVTTMTILRWTSGHHHKPTAKNLGTPICGWPQQRFILPIYAPHLPASINIHPQPFRRTPKAGQRCTGQKVPETRHQFTPRHHLRVIVIGSDPRIPKSQGRLAAKVVVGGRQQASQQASRKQADESVTTFNLRYRAGTASDHEESSSCGPFSLISHSHSFHLPYA